MPVPISLEIKVHETSGGVSCMLKPREEKQADSTGSVRKTRFSVPSTKKVSAASVDAAIVQQRLLAEFQARYKNPNGLKQTEFCVSPSHANTAVRIPEEQRPLTLVTRWATPVTTAEINRTYGAFMADAIERAAASIKAGGIKDVMALYRAGQKDRLLSMLHTAGIPHEELQHVEPQAQDQKLRKALYLYEHERQERYLRSNAAAVEVQIIDDFSNAELHLFEKWSKFSVCSDEQQRALCARILETHVPKNILNEKRAALLKEMEDPDLPSPNSRSEERRALRQALRERYAFRDLYPIVPPEALRSMISAFLMDPVRSECVARLKELYISKMAHRDAEKFVNQYVGIGNERTFQYPTCIFGQYEYFRHVISEHLNDIVSSHESMHMRSGMSAPEMTEYRRGDYTVGIDLPLRDVPHRKFYVKNTGGTTFNGTLRLDEQNKAYDFKDVWLYPRPPQVDRKSGSSFNVCHADAQKHYAAALQTKEHQAAVNEALAGYWHSIQAGFSARGSAAITEYALRSVLLARNIVLPPVVEGKSIDLAANLYAKEEFVARAHEWFGEF